MHDRIGATLAELRRYDEADSEFKKAAHLDPSSPWPYFYMAKALAKQGRDGPAAAEFREALRIEPDDFEILAYAAQLLSASEDPQVRDGQTALAYAQKAGDGVSDCEKRQTRWLKAYSHSFLMRLAWPAPKPDDLMKLNKPCKKPLTSPLPPK